MNKIRVYSYKYNMKNYRDKQKKKEMISYQDKQYNKQNISINIYSYD